ncbi:MAG: tetratricopeptide repeat protein [Cyclobacteriaceae bacterium]
MRTDFHLARELCEKSLKYSSETNNELYEIKSLFLLAWLEKKMLNYRQSSNIYFQIILKQPNLVLDESKEIVLSAYKNLSYIVSDYNDFELASMLNREAFLLAYRELKDSSLMIKYLRPQLSIYVEQSDFYNCINLANHITSNYSIKDDYFKNEINFFKGISHQNLENTELALVIFNDILKDTATDDLMTAKIFHQTGLIYLKQERYKEAIKTIEKAILINKLNNAHTSLFLNYNALAESYAALMNYSRAINYYELMIDMHRQHNINNNLKFEIIPKLIQTLQLVDDQDKIDRYKEEHRVMMEDYYATKQILSDANEATDLAVMKIKMKELVADRQNMETQNPSFYFEASIALLFLILSIGFYYLNSKRRKIAIMNDLKKIGIESNI